MPFYTKWYLAFLDAQYVYDSSMPHLNYIYNLGIAESLQNPLLLSSVNYEDKEETVKKKLDTVARYIETFTVRRSVNYKKFSQTSIKYTMFNVIKKIRNNNIDNLIKNITSEINEMEFNFDAVMVLGFVCFLHDIKVNTEITNNNFFIKKMNNQEKIILLNN